MKQYPDSHRQYSEYLAADIIYALSEDGRVQCLAGLTDPQMFHVQRTIEAVIIKKLADVPKV